MIELKYNFEYFCSPIWIKKTKNTNSIFENIDVMTFPISHKLKIEICDLNTIYQSTFNDKYPPEPHFLPMEKELSFCSRVIESAIILSREISSEYNIFFDANKWTNKLNEIKKQMNLV